MQMGAEQNQTAALDYSACRSCGGSRYELIWRYVEGYGDAEFAVPCTACSKKPRREDLTRVPAQFRDADINKFNFGSYSRDMGRLKRIAEDFVKNYRKRWESCGKGIYLWSRTPGSGKTFLSCCMAKSAMIKFDLRMRFIAAADYISKVGESYKGERGEYDESRAYRECDLLVLDDIGAQKGGEWQDQEILRIVNDRMQPGKVTLFTSNCSPEKLNVDERIISRIIKKTVVLQMPEESIRGSEAKKEQERFLESILSGKGDI